VIAEGGRRERKKQQTRELIAETARRLFEERGFEAVTVAEIAREADLSEKTVFNYFPTKEDLFYNRMESFEEELLAAIRGRDPGVSVLEAFRGFLDQPRGMLADPRAAEARERLARITRVITESPALQAREQQVLRRYTESLAALIAEDAGAAPDDVRPWVAANALMGIHRSLIELVRARTLAGGDDPAALARDLREHAEQAFALLESGLGDYAPGREP